MHTPEATTWEVFSFLSLMDKPEEYKEGLAPAAGMPNEPALNGPFRHYIHEKHGILLKQCLRQDRAMGGIDITKLRK